MQTIKNVIDRVLYVIVAVLFAVLVCIVVWQVFSRQVLGTPSTWTEEGARMTFVWLGLFASALIFGERGHVAVEFVARKLPEDAERKLALAVQVVILIFALTVLVYGGWRAAGNAWQQQLAAVPFTLGQMYVALPVSGVLVSFYSLFYILSIANGNEKPYGDNSDEFVATNVVESVHNAGEGSLLFGQNDSDSKGAQSPSSTREA